MKYLPLSSIKFNSTSATMYGNVFTNLVTVKRETPTIKKCNNNNENDNDKRL